MTSPNPTPSEIDALILAKVKEVVPEYSKCIHDVDVSCFCKVGIRPIQLADIMRLCHENLIACMVESRGKMILYGKVPPPIEVDWNLSLDWAHQEYATKLAIWKLIQPE